MAEARKAASKHGTKLLLCLGGNGRSGGFSVMVRQAFVKHPERDVAHSGEKPKEPAQLLGLLIHAGGRLPAGWN